MPGTSPHGNRLILTMKRLMGLLGVDHTVRLPIYGRVVSRSGAGCRREFRRSQALARAQARKNQHSLRPSTTNSIVECSDLNLPARPARLFGSSQSDPHSLRGCPAGVPCGGALRAHGIRRHAHRKPIAAPTTTRAPRQWCAATNDVPIVRLQGTQRGTANKFTTIGRV
jgi:hypothetical protein